MRYNKELVKIIADKYSGKFIDEDFVSSKFKHNWECKLGHRFQKKLERILRGEWCPVCSSSKSERFCRFCFEEMIGKSFPKRKDFDWLRNSNGNKMELDGYCEELGLAFEYQGKQHYDLVTKYQDKPTELERRMQDDYLKKSLCNDHNIHLIQIPYTVNPENMEDYITTELAKVIKIKVNKIDYYKYNYYSDELALELENIAKEKKGKIIRIFAEGNKQYAECYCEEHKYTWIAIVQSIRSNKWCKFCGYRKSKEKDARVWTLEDLKEFAKENGGKCLSETYTGKNEELVWKCKIPEHPIYRRSPSKVVRNKYMGCQECSNKKRISIEDMIIHANKHGGKCLSLNLPNHGKSIVEFECARYPEHPRFTKKASDIKNRTKLWCPLCEGGKIVKHSLSKIKDLARNYGYECLSDEYISNSINLQWRCLTCNYVWFANFRIIQRKIKKKQCWCEKCLLNGKLHTISTLNQ
jgi:hypothetical protein